MLSDAIAAFLDSVSERAFDEPLLALLRSQGFESVHLVHGQREFGKDVIGQREGAQWAWQSKAGDVGQAEWRELVGQLDELRLVNLGHGAFDADLERHPVLVITGRLTGNAPDLFRDYNQRANERGEPTLELWDRDILVGLLSDKTDAVLRGSADGGLLGALASVEEKTATMQVLELFSRRWSTWELERLTGLGVIEASLLCERLAEQGRLDLACHLALCLVRGAWAVGAEDLDASQTVADAAGRLFDGYAAKLWDQCSDELLDEDFVASVGMSAWVSYPALCGRVAELMGLWALRLRSSDSHTAGEVTQWLVRFAAAQPAVAHSIGDRYAVSLAPLALALATTDAEAAERLLKDATVWLCDCYGSDRLGLASVDADEIEETERLLGSALDSVQLERRRDSTLATVLLDLCAALGFSELYADAWNDIQAVKIHPRVLRLADGPDAYDRAAMSNRLDPNVDFASSLEESPTAPHHADSAGQQLCAQGRSWDLLAISSSLRDRHFYCSLELNAHANT